MPKAPYEQVPAEPAGGGAPEQDHVFIDVDTIEPGMDFAEEISLAVAACQVLVAVIGPVWLAARRYGTCRIGHEGDCLHCCMAADHHFLPEDRFGRRTYKPASNAASTLERVNDCYDRRPP